MTGKYIVRSVWDIENVTAVRGHLDGFLSPECARYVGDTQWCNRDVRGIGEYNFGGMCEPNLESTWSAFEADYHATPHYGLFWMCDIEDAVVHPPFSIVSVGNILIRETIHDSGMLAATFPGLDRKEARRAIKYPSRHLNVDMVDEGVVLNERCDQLGWGRADNYFNWTLRYAAKIAVVQRGAEGHRIIVPTPTQSFVDRGLEFFGVPQRLAYHLAERTKVRHLRLTAPGALGRYQISPTVPAALRDNPAVARLWQVPPTQIYVMRGAAAIRQVTNESAVIAYLRDRNFCIVDPGQHTLVDQIRMFQAATLVVGPHGAGLTNIAYCQPGTTIIECVPEGYDQGVTSYRSMADMFGLRHLQIFGREVIADPAGNRCNSHIEIPIAALARALDLVAP